MDVNVKGFDDGVNEGRGARAAADLRREGGGSATCWTRKVWDAFQTSRRGCQGGKGGGWTRRGMGSRASWMGWF